MGGGVRPPRSAEGYRERERRSGASAVERSGTSALGVPRPSLPPSWPKAMTPPSQREARGYGLPRQCEHWLAMTGQEVNNEGERNDMGDRE